MAASIAWADEPAWVRLHHSSDVLASRGVEASVKLQDYGSFQWGTLSRLEISRLQSAGVTLSVIDNPFVLHLGGKSFDPRASASQSDLFQSYQADPGGDFHLIQFNGPVRREWLEDARAAGLELVQYIHPFTYVVWGQADSMLTQRSHPAVRWGGAFLPEFRVLPHQIAQESAPVASMALVSRHVDQSKLVDQLSAAGAVVDDFRPVTRHLSTVLLDVPGNRFEQLAQIPGLYTLQRIPAGMGPRGEMSNQSVVGNFGPAPGNQIFPGYADWLMDTGFDGSGVIVGVVDGGIRVSHQDLVGRVEPCVSADGQRSSCTSANNTHGTHVAAAIAGTGASGVTNATGFLRGQGVAPGAQVVQQRYPVFLVGSPPCNDPNNPGCMRPDAMLTIFRESALSGALLTNNSWGPTGTPQGYDIPTQQIDLIARDARPELEGQQGILPVWSIMNGNGDSGGACAPSSLGSPDEAKNLFAVGSTRLQNLNESQQANIFDLSPNSAHGPTCDGRMGPHIVAPGCRTDSAGAGGDSAFGLSCGTSMASPLVSGAVAIFAEYFQALQGQFPSPAMMKAAVSAVATNLHGSRNANNGLITQTPSRFQGFGRLDLDAVVNSPFAVFYFDQEHIFSESGQSWSLPFLADDPSKPVRLMLTWTDAPGHGLGGSTPAWVNDLDLRVAANGAEFWGNQLGDDGFAQTGGVPDDRNNMEAVFLRPDQHQGGFFEVTVNAAHIAADALSPHEPQVPRQDFALVCYNCIVATKVFSVALSPDELALCLADAQLEDQVVEVELQAHPSSGRVVELSVVELPEQVQSIIQPTQLRVPGRAEWTLQIGESADPDRYHLELKANDGHQPQSAVLTLILDATLNTGPELITPQNEAIDVSLNPSFVWSEQPGAAEYRFQLAADANFEKLLWDETISSATVITGLDLDEALDYFWRVSSSNLCGQGNWSEVFLFTTLTLPEPGRIELSSTALSLKLVEELAISRSFEIANVGETSLTWQLDQATSECQLPEWLSVTPALGELEPDADQMIRVDVSAQGLVSGTYQAQICFSSSEPDVELSILSVELLVVPPSVFQDRFDAVD